jgi:hypothetical protein
MKNSFEDQPNDKIMDELPQQRILFEGNQKYMARINVRVEKKADLILKDMESSYQRLEKVLKALIECRK